MSKLNPFQLFLRQALLYPLASPFLPPVDKVQAGYSYANGNLIGTLEGGGEVSKLNEDRTYYIAPDGNDTTGDGSTETPYLTIQKCIDLIPKDLNGHYVEIILKDGTYPTESAPILFQGFFDTAPLNNSYMSIYGEGNDIETTILATIEKTTFKNCSIEIYFNNIGHSAHAFEICNCVYVDISNTAQVDQTNIEYSNASYTQNPNGRFLSTIRSLVFWDLQGTRINGAGLVMDAGNNQLLAYDLSPAQDNTLVPKKWVSDNFAPI